MSSQDDDMSPSQSQPQWRSQPDSQDSQDSQNSRNSRDSQDSRYISSQGYGFNAILSKNFQFYQADALDTVQYIVAWGDGSTTPEPKESFPDTTAIDSFDRHHSVFRPHPDRYLHPYAKAAETSYHTIINKLWELQRDNKAVKEFDGDKMSFRPSALLILAAMPYGIVRNLCCGTLARARFCDGGLRDEIEAMRNPDEILTTADKKRPGIYMWEFIDDQGLPPSILHFKELTNAMLKYLDDDKYALDVDGRHDLTQPEQYAYKGGWRKPLDDSLASSKSTRRDVFRQFVKRFDEFLDKCDPAETHPPFTLRYIGYAYNMQGRIIGHDQGGTQSNRHMNMVKKLSDYLWTTQHQVLYRFQHSVLFWCFQRSQSALGEAILAAISGADCESPFGLNKAPAGESVASTLKLGNIADWEAWDAQVYDQGTFLKHIDEEEVRCQAIIAAYDAKDAEVKRLREHVAQLELKQKAAYLRREIAQRRLDNRLMEIRTQIREEKEKKEKYGQAKQ